jgi:hypothetical protein
VAGRFDALPFDRVYLADVWHSHHWIDFRDWATAVATAAAAVFAAWTIRQAKKQAERSAADLVRERRIDWELGLLKELAQEAEGDVNVPGGGVRQGLLLRLRLLGDKRLPTLRAAIGMETTPEAQQYINKLRERDRQPEGIQLNSGLALAREDIRREIDTEITRLLRERDPSV